MKSVVLGDAHRDTCNFQVADTHTFFVGTLKAWVHNACDPGICCRQAAGCWVTTP